MRIVFFGSPEFAATVLRGLIDAGANIVGVVSQPDKPAGRGNQLRAPAVKVVADQLGLDLLQPAKVRDGALAQWVRNRTPDLGVVAAYGRILTQEVLDAPRLGCVNVHASLLPRWRGASPIARALAAGDAASGVCLMQMDAGLDTGAVLDRTEVPIAEDDTTPSLEARLAAAGSALIAARLPDLMVGRLVPMRQPTEGVSWAPPVDKSEGRLAFSQSARTLHAQVRAMQPWPGAFFASALAPGEDWKVFPEDLRWDSAEGTPGELLSIQNDGAWIGCGSGRLFVAWMQRPGKGRVAAADLLRGVRAAPGAQLSVLA